MSSDTKDHIRDKLQCRPAGAVALAQPCESAAIFPKPGVRWSKMCTGQPSFVQCQTLLLQGQKGFWNQDLSLELRWYANACDKKEEDQTTNVGGKRKMAALIRQENS